MKRWVIATTAGVLLVLVPLLVAATWSTSTPTSAQPACTLTLPINIEVGKTYGFGVNGTELTGKVLSEPCGNWVKVDVRERGKVQEVWLNLLQVSYILPNPSTQKSNPGTC